MSGIKLNYGSTPQRGRQNGNLGNWCRLTIWLGLIAAILAGSSQTLSGSKFDRVAKHVEIGIGKPIHDRGKLFFPLGFYHISYQDTQKSHRDRAVKDIAAAGFNLMHVPLSLKAQDRAFLDRAAALGIRIIGEPNNEDLLNLVETYKNHPAILGWNVGDDVDNGKKNPTSIAKLQDRVKAINPQQLTYLSGYTPAGIGRFADAADLIGMQSYPIPTKPISQTNIDLTSAVAAANLHHKSPIANIQTFAWAKSRAPTPLEVRNMTYQALINGVKGIIYYTYYDSTWDLSRNPKLWTELKSLVPEIQQLSPFLIQGKLTKITSDIADVSIGIWTYKSQKIAAVINTSTQRSSQVNISLPGIKFQKATAMFANRRNGLKIDRGKLIGVIKPIEVQVYRLN